jgi:hypothetical protein
VSPDDTLPPSAPISTYERPLMDRVADLETAVFGNPRQRVPGLIDSLRAVSHEVTEIKDMVAKLRDNRLAWAQLIGQVATFAAAVAALYTALNGKP